MRDQTRRDETRRDEMVNFYGDARRDYSLHFSNNGNRSLNNKNSTFLKNRFKAITQNQWSDNFIKKIMSSLLRLL
jgi:hypothetical protein